MAVQDTKVKNTRLIAIIAGVVAVAVLAFFGVPYMTAESWRSDALDATNNAITEINKTNNDISVYGNKLQPDKDDYTKLAAACEAQNNAVKKGKSDLGELGGFAGFDVTGAYKKATDTRAKLVGAYDELSALNSACVNRANAEKEVSEIVAGVESLESPEGAAAAAKSLHEAAAKIKTFAETADGTQYDKDVAVAIEDLASGLDKLVAGYDAGDNAVMEEGFAMVENAATRLDDLDAASADHNAALQKKSDDAIDRLNAAAKELE